MSPPKVAPYPAMLSTGKQPVAQPASKQARTVAITKSPTAATTLGRAGPHTSTVPDRTT